MCQPVQPPIPAPPAGTARSSAIGRFLELEIRRLWWAAPLVNSRVTSSILRCLASFRSLPSILHTRFHGGQGARRSAHLTNSAHRSGTDLSLTLVRTLTCPTYSLTPPEVAYTRLAIRSLLLPPLQKFDIADTVSTARSLYVLRPQREHGLQHIDMRRRGMSLPPAAARLARCPRYLGRHFPPPI